MQDFFKKMLQVNLKHLVSKIENRFNTKIYEFGVEEQGSQQFNDLVPSSLKNSLFIGYLAIPVDEDAEYIITIGGKKDYDLSHPMERYEAMQNIFSVDSVKEFIQTAFQGQVYRVKAVLCSYSPVLPTTIEDIDEYDDAQYLYWVYAVSM